MNLLKMELKYSIETLLKQGWSRRRIARELGIDRDTVGRYAARLEKKEGPNAAKVTTGKESITHSSSEEHRQWIEAKLEDGLSAQRIYQDAVSELGFKGSYQSIKRFTRRLKGKQPERFWRMEVQPGQESQIDFCSGYWLKDDKGYKRKVHIFRMVLGFSRKGHSQAVLHQDTESFLRCIENGFRRFGGVTETLNLDNLKAAVIQADWYDPQFNPKLVEFARFYDTAILPCKPRLARHKELVSYYTL